MEPSSSVNTEATEAQATSYVSMDDVGDPTLIGKHCQLEYCQQLDFLPFLCQSCRKTFCLEHRTEDDHKCANRGAWGRRRRELELAKAVGASRQLNYRVREKVCDEPSCKSVIGTGRVPGVHCDTCRRDYCNSHRIKEDHNCQNLTPIGARPARQPVELAERTKGALSKLRAWGSAKKEEMGRALPKPKPSSAAQRIAALNAMKKTAKGDAKLAPEKRLYLHVEAEAQSTVAKVPQGDFFYNKDWVVGRILDEAARGLQVQNLNNRSKDEKDKLRVFHVEGGRLLEFNEKAGEVLVNGNNIVLLRGVGPPPELIGL